MESRAYTMGARAEAVDATRRGILAAAERLFRDHWWDEVTLAGIAKGAGVSHQTVLNHFGSKDGVLAALIEYRDEETTERRGEATPEDTAAAIAGLLRQYEEWGLANARASHQEHRVPALKVALDRARAFHRDWVERVFAHALPEAEPERTRRIAAFLGATEVTVWKTLHHDYGFSRRDTAVAMTEMINALEARP